MELSEYRQYHETKNHSRPGFAYNTYVCTIPLDFPRVSLHWHDQMEIIYIKKGTGTVTVNFHSMPVSEGFIVPILPGEPHSIEADANSRMEYENIIFSLSILNNTETDDWCDLHVIDPLQTGALTFPRPIIPGNPFHDEVSDALDQADRFCEAKTPGYFLMVKSALFQFLHALYVNQEIHTADPAANHSDRLKVLLTWVKEHYRENITVEQAAQIVGYSTSHFMRTFKQETGQTFIQYLNDYRLTTASYYLAETEKSISRIAQDCGFDNLSYFMRMFKKTFSMSPNAYRRYKRGAAAG